jgi:hypothetical protein
MSNRFAALFGSLLAALALLGCDSSVLAIDPVTGQIVTYASHEEVPAGWVVCEVDCSEVMVEPTLRNGAPIRFSQVYQAEEYAPVAGTSRPWVPMDLTPSTHGELWVVQRMERLPEFDEFTECTSRSQAGQPNDCLGLQGSTVALRDPANPELASGERVNLVVDANAWHFMRRPSGIAFGVESTTLPADDPRALDPITGEPLLTEAATYPDIFATCHEHWTGNFTDSSPFIGPSLWSADPEIYNGVNGDFEWSNGSHLDMVHATQNCMGIAWEQGNVYWLFNGEEGALDRYDFGVPHVPGAADHDDGEVTRYVLDSPLARVPNVPSNLVMRGDALYVADTGNGRVARFDLAQEMTPDGTFRTYEALPAEQMRATLATVVSREALAAAWGAEVEPSGLAFYDEDTFVVANHASGQISLVRAEDGEILRTEDTGLGAGIGGLTVMDGLVYFTHMGTRGVYRVDVGG